ncbi:hypothetical protein TWF679_002636 [Orbilia oligospora]|uniref:Uncharacterized protein n=1 Tax=Orbilia oligospora TaxID=2813651 RepID=A0A8H8UT02_ORBOL|nr:hypothetical protein TWF679_002636 [Orbilia oligospora]
MADTRFTQEGVDRLKDRLRKGGLRTKIELEDGKDIVIVLGRETLKIGTWLQNQVFDLITKNLSDRYAVQFAEELLQMIKTTNGEDIIAMKRRKRRVESSITRNPNDLNYVCRKAFDFLQKT